MSVLCGGDASENMWRYVSDPLSLMASLPGSCSASQPRTESGDAKGTLLNTTPLVMEFINTLMLCFSVGKAVGLHSFFAPLSTGSILMATITLRTLAGTTRGDFAG